MKRILITALLALVAATGTAQPPEVPLRRWTSPQLPQGVVFGQTRGVSIGDYDGDGWADVFSASSGELWRNVAGQTWQLAADLNEGSTAVLGSGFRYGAAFGDYDNDGLPDLAVEPRVWPGFPDNFELLHNLGGGRFAQVASTAATIISSPSPMDAETNCWGDVDGDGDLDLFVPAYPPWGGVRGTTGNVFWTNRGPTGPDGAYRFAETTVPSGLYNTPGSTRPEGAQLCDVDGDGDLDLYSNGTLYQNRSLQGVPAFAALSEAATGIGLRSELDEGALLCDYDNDGDFDLLVSYWASGIVLWENRGDGNFRRESGVVAQPQLGIQLGISAEDWDQDGDLDLTTREVFRRNLLVETGQRRFALATHTIPAQHITTATPAWADWDRDGDLDCVLANWGELARLYENTTYDAQTPSAQRRTVRLRPLRDSVAVPSGLENEFGAVGEVAYPGGRQRKFTSAAGGYLNQNEYALHFGLPPDPTPTKPGEDLPLELAVQFAGVEGQGARRVDRHVNPALALDFADLQDREIDVFRSGRVVVDGCDIQPEPMEDPTTWATAGGLATPRATALPQVTPAAGPDWFVGLAFDTTPATGPVRVTEVVVDGQLDVGFAMTAGIANVVLWDVTDPLPVAVPGAQLLAPGSARNDRHAVAVDWVLPAGRSYRVVAQVTGHRASPFAGPSLDGPVRAHGGLLFQDGQPRNAWAMAHATVDGGNLFLALRARAALAGVWSDLGNGSGGASQPEATGQGIATPGAPVSLTVSGAPPGAAMLLVLGQKLACTRTGAGALLPEVGGVVSLTANAQGQASMNALWPSSAQPLSLVAQAMVASPTTPGGVALSNGVWVQSR